MATMESLLEDKPHIRLATVIDQERRRYHYDLSTNPPMLSYILAMVATDLLPSCQPIKRSTKNKKKRESNKISQQITTIVSWIMENEHRQLEPQHRIITKLNCWLSVKQYSSQRVEQGTISNPILTAIIPCVVQEDKNMRPWNDINAPDFLDERIFS
ncbi:hypothetical protein BDC45DRAFT_530621 [Circinella umbellata]|nr:hypothetical protein BDC45DRAFT_530621 [Circinella umbellata]